MATNLPPPNVQDSASSTKLVFNNYGKDPLEFNAVEVDAAISFFKKRGFDDDAALTVATTILTRAKIEGTPTLQILDGLKNFDGLQLSTLVGEILNNDRPSTSTLGFRVTPVVTNIARNIAA